VEPPEHFDRKIFGFGPLSDQPVQRLVDQRQCLGKRTEISGPAASRPSSAINCPSRSTLDLTPGPSPCQFLTIGAH
jgi:hypothetical protein